MSLIACPECTKQISSFAPYCPGCGCPIKTSTEAKLSQTPGIVIDDINMQFGSMVIFMIKWALASIPALIILLILFSFVAAIFAGGMASLLYPNQ
jgi:hypothetical protein